MTTPPQPGWYDDPGDSNAQRYWDGQGWTPHQQRKPLARQTPAPVTPTPLQRFPANSPPPPPPPDKPVVRVPTVSTTTGSARSEQRQGNHFCDGGWCAVPKAGHQLGQRRAGLRGRNSARVPEVMEAGHPRTTHANVYGLPRSQPSTSPISTAAPSTSRTAGYHRVVGLRPDIGLCALRQQRCRHRGRFSYIDSPEL